MYLLVNITLKGTASRLWEGQKCYDKGDKGDMRDETDICGIKNNLNITLPTLNKNVGWKGNTMLNVYNWFWLDSDH